MWIRPVFAFIQVMAINYVVLSLHETVAREKRHVVYPNGGTFKIVMGIAIPVKLGSKQSMACGWNFQFQYAEATNVTQLQVYPPIIGKSSSRERRSNSIAISERRLAYLTVESMMKRHNLNGRACILRSICENASHPLNHPANGLYGHLLYIFLTPDSGSGVEEDLDVEYVEAQNAGARGLDCDDLYAGCRLERGLLDLISLLDY